VVSRLAEKSCRTSACGPLSKPQHLTESNFSSVSSIARVIAAGEASRGLRSSWLRSVIFSVIGLCAAL
jgi:hypothetical protein